MKALDDKVVKRKAKISADGFKQGLGQKSLTSVAQRCLYGVTSCLNEVVKDWTQPKFVVTCSQTLQKTQSQQALEAPHSKQRCSQGSQTLSKVRSESQGFSAL